MKKGVVDSSIILFCMYILVVSLVMLAVFDFVMDKLNGTDFDKIYLSRDIALLINTIYLSPGNLNLDYSLENDYNFEIGKTRENHKVRLQSIKEFYKLNRVFVVSYVYVSDLYLPGIGLVKQGNILNFIKNKDKVEIK